MSWAISARYVYTSHTEQKKTEKCTATSVPDGSGTCTRGSVIFQSQSQFVNFLLFSDLNISLTQLDRKPGNLAFNIWRNAPLLLGRQNDLWECQFLRPHLNSSAVVCCRPVAHRLQAAERWGSLWVWEHRELIKSLISVVPRHTLVNSPSSEGTPATSAPENHGRILDVVR